MGRLDGRRALVVGASRGIGAEVGRAFARAGAAVALSARSSEALEAVVAEIQDFGGTALAIAGDATDSSSVEETIATAEEALGGIEILCFSAGAIAIGRFEEIDDEVWARLFELNVLGAVRFARRVLPQMRRNGWGRIINIASTAGKYGSRYQSPYNASKHAVVGLTRCLALETAGEGITVNAICPGLVGTDLTEDAMAEWARSYGVGPEEMMQAFLDRIPIGRLLEAGEVAELATYVASPAADGMTGQGLTLDGGLILV